MLCIFSICICCCESMCILICWCIFDGAIYIVHSCIYSFELLMALQFNINDFVWYFHHRIRTHDIAFGCNLMNLLTHCGLVILCCVVDFGHHLWVMIWCLNGKQNIIWTLLIHHSLVNDALASKKLATLHAKVCGSSWKKLYESSLCTKAVVTPIYYVWCRSSSARIFLQNYVNTMAVDALDPHIARPMIKNAI